MNSQGQKQTGARIAPSVSRRNQPISHILLADGALSSTDMLAALAEATRLNQPVARVLEAEGLAAPDRIQTARAQRIGALHLSRDRHPVDDRVLSLLPAAFCLEHGVLPWTHIGDTLVIASADPENFGDLESRLPNDIGPWMPAVATRDDIHAVIAERHGAALARNAETRRPATASCRDLAMPSPSTRMAAAALLCVFLALLWTAPQLLFGVALALALASLLTAQVLKLAALTATARPARPEPRTPPLPRDPPVVSILVPLFHERAIAQDLVARLSRLTYPRTLLDVILVLETGDTQTQEALAGVDLPPWMRRVEVPPGTPMTKPRALNYALRFARGDIVGLYDAEDSPAPDQIERVAARFDAAPPDVACLQGILDFYNPRANWLSRCFTIEYASWFRVMLPGLARLGFAVPLGGTTLFLRRDAIETVGGWDAHNVTEDADLGILLARHGYRTELIRTVTREEANNRFWPWIRQRSRWLKGYAITWWVHSRHPRRLWRDLGPWRFVGMQALFLTTIAQFVLAPVLWSFWLVLAGLPHPLDGTLSEPQMTGLIALFLGAEAVTLAFGLVALARSPHTGLMPWVPTLFAYFPLGTFAIYKGIGEVLRKPFYWDKTEHGHCAPDTPQADLPPG